MHLTGCDLCRSSEPHLLPHCGKDQEVWHTIPIDIRDYQQGTEQCRIGSQAGSHPPHCPACKGNRNVCEVGSLLDSGFPQPAVTAADSGQSWEGTWVCLPSSGRRGEVEGKRQPFVLCFALVPVVKRGGDELPGSSFWEGHICLSWTKGNMNQPNLFGFVPFSAGEPVPQQPTCSLPCKHWVRRAGGAVCTHAVHPPVPRMAPGGGDSVLCIGVARSHRDFQTRVCMRTCAHTEAIN